MYNIARNRKIVNEVRNLLAHWFDWRNWFSLINLQ